MAQQSHITPMYNQCRKMYIVRRDKVLNVLYNKRGGEGSILKKSF